MRLRNILFFVLSVPIVALDAWGQTPMQAKQVDIVVDGQITNVQAAFDSLSRSDILVSRLDTGVLQTNFQLANLNFSIISQDFRNAYAYILGGTQVVYSGFTTNFVTKTNIINGITNVFVDAEYSLVSSGFITNSSDGSVSGAALVPVLEHNQGITKTNFVAVNANTYLTTNLFYALGEILGLTNDYATYSNYFTYVDSFLRMETNYSSFPTNLSFNFPNLIQRLDDEIEEVTFNLTDLVLTYDPDGYAFYDLGNSSTNLLVDIQNGKNQYTILSTNVTISFSPAPLHTFSEISLWVLNSNGYVISWNTNNLLYLDSAANSDRSGKTNSFMFNYQTPPWSPSWAEKLVFSDSSVPVFYASGFSSLGAGGVTSEDVVGGSTYKYHTFNSDATFVVSGSGFVDVLLVGGGGGGSTGSTYRSGGGGGEAKVVYSIPVSSGNYSIDVGSKGLIEEAGSSSSAFGFFARGGGGSSNWVNDLPISGYSWAPNGSLKGGGEHRGGSGGSYAGRGITLYTLWGEGGAGTSISGFFSDTRVYGGGGPAGISIPSGSRDGRDSVGGGGVVPAANSGGGGGGIRNASYGSGADGVVVIRYISTF